MDVLHQSCIGRELQDEKEWTTPLEPSVRDWWNERSCEMKSCNVTFVGELSALLTPKDAKEWSSHWPKEPEKSMSGSEQIGDSQGSKQSRWSRFVVISVATSNQKVVSRAGQSGLQCNSPMVKGVGNSGDTGLEAKALSSGREATQIGDEARGGVASRSTGADQKKLFLLAIAPPWRRLFRWQENCCCLLRYPQAFLQVRRVPAGSFTPGPGCSDVNLR